MAYPIIKDKIVKIFSDWKTIILFCLTLGLAPFIPEPHIWGKLKWIAGGGVGMTTMDWLDTLFHGFPWLLLMRWVTIQLVNSFKFTQTKN